LYANVYEAKGGDVIGRNIFGLLTDFKHDPIIEIDKAIIIQNSSSNGMLSLKDTEDEDRVQDFLISSFYEENSGIGTIYITKTKLENNQIKAIDTQPVDLGLVDGIYKPSNGFKTSWNTYLFSQNGLIDSKNSKEFINNYKKYFKNKSNKVNPYKYGWGFETIILNTKGDAKVINHYSLGRTFASNILVMPDNKTVYTYDKQNSKNLYLFVANTANDFSKGNLYVAKKQESSISWVKLGKNSALRLKMKMKKDIEFKDIFKSKKPKDDSCVRGYSFTDTVYGKECLKVNKKFKKYAGTFEPVRYAAIKGVNGFMDVTTFGLNDKRDMLNFKLDGSIKQSYSFVDDEKLNSNYIIK
ncbi:MAG: hypothetical protein U9R37_02510, partial [Campylobacterota bacterium]|nr:hypothetical protein [Campylobacterota bacterium]